VASTLLLKKLLIGAFMLALFFSQFLMTRWPNLIIVPLTFPTLHAALENAKPNARIYVDARRGPYQESVQITKANLIIESVYGRAIFINPRSDQPVIVISADGVRLAGFEIRNGSTGIIVKHAKHVQLVNNVVTNNLQGIVLSDADENQISDNQVVQNKSIGFLLHASSNNSIEGNAISDHPVGGIFVEAGSLGNEFIQNVIKSDQIGVRLLSSPNNEFLENAFWNHADIGLSIESSNGVQVLENHFENNRTGLNLANDLEAVVTDNMFKENSIGLLIQGSTKNLQLSHNQWSGNRVVGLQNDTSENIHAGDNYWGSPDGPRTDPDQMGQGDLVVGSVEVEPWLKDPIR
jgi:parallel beta-helix repeat protein